MNKNIRLTFIVVVGLALIIIVLAKLWPAITPEKDMKDIIPIPENIYSFSEAEKHSWQLSGAVPFKEGITADYDGMGTSNNYTAQFNGGKVNGKAVCNTYEGTYSFDETTGKILFNNISITDKICPEYDSEEAFITAFKNMEFYTYSYENGKYFLSMLGNSLNLVFNSN